MIVLRNIILYSALLFGCFLLQPRVAAQVFPSDSARLHYRIIGFSFPSRPKTGKYILQIADGNQLTEEAFAKKLVRTAEGAANSITAEVPSFGRQYTWRVIYIQGKKETAGDLHYFSTGKCPEVDSALTRLHILKHADESYRDHYVFIDAARALFDMNGRPVWYLPQLDGIGSMRAGVRDLKMTPFGTITFLLDDKPYEISYGGKILWKAPNDGAVSGEKSEHYHHDFTRLSNGHYMVLGNETVTWSSKNATPKDSAFIRSHPGAMRREAMVKTPFGTVIEYNEKGELVWNWKSSKYFIGSDFEDYNPVFKMPTIDVHENSFYFDEKTNYIYVGFKNISRIVKIKYPEGTVANAFGEMYAPGTTEQGNGLFCDQHSCRLSDEGYIYLYNNNGCHQDGRPSVMMFREPKEKNGRLEEVWSYECNANGVKVNPQTLELQKRQQEIKKNINTPNGGLFMLHPTAGGNVQELPGHDLFVAMNAELPKIFIVNRDKELLWNAIPERYDLTRKDWYLIPQQYRASIITHADMQKMIWTGRNQ